MKTTLFALLFVALFASAALGQAAAGLSSLSSVPVAIQIPSHPQRAAQQAMAQEQTLLGHTTYTYAQGERPLWEVGLKPVPVSLGDVARELRKEHATVKRAKKVVEN